MTVSGDPSRGVGSSPLAARPELRIDPPQSLSYDATEAAEPGGLAAAIVLMLSEHPQFMDRDAGCSLVRLARERGEVLADIAKAACPLS